MQAGEETIHRTFLGMRCIRCFMTFSRGDRMCRLTPNPAFGKEDRTLDGMEPAPYMCPVTLQEMNGSHAFVVLFSTGWVMTEKATKEVGLAGLQVSPCGQVSTLPAPLFPC